MRQLVLAFMALTLAAARAVSADPTDGPRPLQSGTSCSTRGVAFDGVQRLTYASIVDGDPQVLSILPTISASCQPASSAACRIRDVLRTGDTVAVGQTCGSVSYVQYIGLHHVTVGWVPTDRVQLQPARDFPTSAILSGVRDKGAYRLSKGRGRPVCEAYLQRLNQTDFDSPAYCGRPESDVVPVFAILKRIPLTVAELDHLLPEISAFTFPGSFPRDGIHHGDATRPWPDGSGAPGYSVADPSIFRYEPLVDIENDGAPDYIVVWMGTGASRAGGYCGAQDGDAFRVDTLAYALFADTKTVDGRKTRSVFGHSAATYGPRDGGDDLDYRPVGRSIGIFKYRELFYFDTFIDRPGDFDNRRKHSPRTSETLGVFLHDRGATRKMCEYRP